MKKVTFKRTKEIDLYCFFEDNDKIKEVKFDNFNVGNKSDILVAQKLTQVLKFLEWNHEEGWNLIEEAEKKYFGY